MKYAFCFCRRIHVERDGKALRFFIALRRRVGTHQHLIAHSQAGVHDFFAPFRWHMLFRWSTLVGEHGFDFAAKTFFIELERSLALAVKSKIRIQLHGALLSPFGAGITSSRSSSAARIAHAGASVASSARA